MTPGAFGRVLAAAALALGVFTSQDRAVAGTAVAPFEVRAQLVSSVPPCRVTVNPVSLACGLPDAPTILRPRPDMIGTLADGWLTYGYRNDAFDSVYAASLTTRLIRYRDWEYIETLVSW